MTTTHAQRLVYIVIAQTLRWAHRRPPVWHIKIGWHSSKNKTTCVVEVTNAFDGSYVRSSCDVIVSHVFSSLLYAQLHAGNAGNMPLSYIITPVNAHHISIVNHHRIPVRVENIHHKHKQQQHSSRRGMARCIHPIWCLCAACVYSA